MSDKWYIYRKGAQEGPYSWDEMIKQARGGALEASDMVWKLGFSDWIRADQV